MQRGSVWPLTFAFLCPHRFFNTTILISVGGFHGRCLCIEILSYPGVLETQQNVYRIFYDLLLRASLKPVEKCFLMSVALSVVVLMSVAGCTVNLTGELYPL